MQHAQTSFSRTFMRRDNESPHAFVERMNALDRTEFRQLPDVVIERRYGWRGGKAACVVHVEHARKVRHTPRGRRGGRRHRGSGA